MRFKGQDTVLEKSWNVKNKCAPAQPKLKEILAAYECLYDFLTFLLYTNTYEYDVYRHISSS